MEPKQDIFFPYLKPLLDVPGSRYILRDWPDKDQWLPSRYIEEGLIPPPGKEGGKSPILIIANLADQMIKATPGAKDTSRRVHSHLKMHDLAHALRVKSGFYAYGPTRVLMWMPDSAKRAFVPRTVGYRSKVAVYIESTFHVEEIAGAVPDVSRARRENSLEAASSKVVAERMRVDGIQLPAERQFEEKEVTTDSSTSRVWHAKLRAMEEDFKSGKLSQFVGQSPRPLVPVKHGPVPTTTTPEYRKYRQLQSTFAHQNRVTNRLHELLHQQEKIDELDVIAHRENDEIKQKHQLNVIDSKVKEFKGVLDTLTPKQREHIFFLDDDRRAFAQSPSLLSWDRRRAQPLIVQPDEFFLTKELALLDFQPLGPEKQFPLTSEQSVYFDMLCTSLFGPRGYTTLKYLNHVGPGAYEAIVPKLPALTDPTKGGRRDVESLRVRTLTPEMLWRLTVAWDQWPFKQTMTDLINRTDVNPGNDLGVRTFR